MATSVVYYGHISEICGHGSAARDYIDLLVQAGFDVSGRNIGGNDGFHYVDNRWQALCSKPIVERPDIFIVHKAPWNQNGHVETFRHLPEYKNARQRIYITIFETSRWPANWKEVLDNYEKIITASEWQRQAAIAMLGKDAAKRVFTIPHVLRKNFEYQPKPGPFTFFAEYSRVSHRKGLDVMLKAYYLAFNTDSKVRLKVKVGSYGDGEKRFYEELKKAADCFAWKTHPPIEFTTAILSDFEMSRIWDGVDAYVCSARGEGFGLSTAQAMLNGIPVLAPRGLTGPDWHYDYLTELNAGYYKANWVPVITDEFSNVKMVLDTTGMEWLEPDVPSLAENMSRIANKPKTPIPANHRSNNLSDQNVLKMFKEVFGK